VGKLSERDAYSITGGKVVDDAGVDRCPVGGDLDRSGARVERAGEERSCSAGITAFGDEDVDDLACRSTAR